MGLQSVSAKVSFVSNKIIFAYILVFKAKTKFVTDPLPGSYTVIELTDFVGSSDEILFS